jgi:agmatine deiminase
VTRRPRHSDSTPASLGFRRCAEWEAHEATWLGWPHNLSDWPRKFAPIPWVYGEIVRKLAAGENVRIIVNSQEHESSARRVLQRAGAELSRVGFFRFPTNRGWTRDFGPMFVRRPAPEPELAITAFRFNAWAKYPDYRKDLLIHERAARELKVRLFRPSFNGEPVVLEGGAIDTNGSGTLITTEECLLDRETQARNPGMSREDLEEVLGKNLGITNVLWLGKGIAGDDTHGHVDDLCRFVGHHTVVLCQEKDSADPNYAPLQENWERLEDMCAEDGTRLEVVALPMPAPLTFDGQRLPASYANFYVANSAVLVPTFNDPNDRIALGILSELFTDRPVIGIHAVDLVWGLGTLHCLTHEQPAL